MSKSKFTVLVLMALVLFPAALFCFDVEVFVNTETNRAAISPYIYGSNQFLTDTENMATLRMGGNRMTGYNWENNASNAGSDYNHSSDNFVPSWIGVPSGSSEVPGIAIKTFHDKNLAKNRYSLVTLQMAGYVAKDKNGTVATTEAAPSTRWDKVQFAKGSAFTLTPSLTDGIVYMDEFVNFMVSNYGNASTATGVKGYSLDNEPALWSNTHPRIHPAAVTCAELIDTTTNLAKAVKNVDDYAEIFGPAAYGFGEYVALQWAADWPPAGYTSDDYFLDYYLTKMKAASDAAGKRLLDVLDVHYYPEAYAAGNRVVFYSTSDYTSATSQLVSKVRTQMGRTLWDPNYCTSINHEDSWILNLTQFQKYFPLIPKLKESIAKYYPGTKLGITEYGFGGDDHISGAIAMADALGYFGELGLYYATYWQILSTIDYTSSAFKLYRNYDGNNSTFGNTKVYSQINNIPQSAVYAAITGTSNTKLDMILINKDLDNAMNASVTIASSVKYNSGVVYGVDSTSSTIRPFTAISSITNNKFTYALPKGAVVHIVLSSDGSAAPAPTPTAPPLPTPNPFEGKLEAHYSCGDTAAVSSQMRFNLKIVNTGLTGVSYDAIKLRYYYTDPQPANFVFNVDYAAVGNAKVFGAFNTNYVEITFATGMGGVGAGGNSGDIQLRITRPDYSNITNSDDYSFGPTYSAYAAYDKVTMYLNGNLIWGVEPPTTGTLTPSPTATPTRTSTITATVTSTTGPTPTRTATINATTTATTTTGATPTRTSTTVTRTATATRTSTATRTATSAVTPTRTATTNATATITRTVTATTGATPTATSTTVGCTCDAGCATITAITPNFTKDGSGVFCFEAASMGSYVNSWNLTVLEVNGVDITNKWIPYSSLPAPIGGKYYVYYNSTVTYGHLEIMN